MEHKEEHNTIYTSHPQPSNCQPHTQKKHVEVHKHHNTGVNDSHTASRTLVGRGLVRHRAVLHILQNDWGLG